MSTYKYCLTNRQYGTTTSFFRYLPTKPNKFSTAYQQNMWITLALCAGLGEQKQRKSNKIFPLYTLLAKTSFIFLQDFLWLHVQGQGVQPHRYKVRPKNLNT